MNMVSKLQIVKWDESTIQDVTDSSKLTKAIVVFKVESNAFVGDINVEYSMFYEYHSKENPIENIASYMGFMLFNGTLDGKTGGFVLTDNGTFKKGIAKSQLIIIHGSGTDKLKNISGNGQYHATHNENLFTLEYKL